MFLASDESAFAVGGELTVRPCPPGPGKWLPDQERMIPPLLGPDPEEPRQAAPGRYRRRRVAEPAGKFEHVVATHHVSLMVPINGK